MSQESYSDFSVIKDYIEIRNKYDDDVKIFKDKIKTMEVKFRKHVEVLELEIKKRNGKLKAYEDKTRQLAEQIAEKDEQLKNLGLQLHRLKLAAQQDSQ